MMSELTNKYKIDRTAFSVAELGDESDTRAYWRSRTPEERLQVVEFLRQLVYGDDLATSRIQRVFEVIDLKQR
jgi:hypothetical protein